MRGRSVVLTMVAVFAGGALPVHRAEAQLAELIPGVHVRVRAPGSLAGRFAGTVVARTADSLTIASDEGVPVQLPLSRLTAVEISRGQSRSKGAMKGMLWGGGIGLAAGLISDSGQENCTRDCILRSEMIGYGLLGGIMWGAGIGAIVQSERWERLDLPVRTALLRTRGGPTVVVSISF